VAATNMGQMQMGAGRPVCAEANLARHQWRFAAGGGLTTPAVFDTSSAVPRRHAAKAWFISTARIGLWVAANSERTAFLTGRRARLLG